MNKPSPVIWLAIVLFLLLPSAAGKFFLNFAGGLIILFLLIPVLLTSIGWVGWRIIKSKFITCSSCGASFFNESSQCPICGSSVNNIKSESKNNYYKEESKPASSVTIDITPEKDK